VPQTYDDYTFADDIYSIFISDNNTRSSDFCSPCFDRMEDIPERKWLKEDYTEMRLKSRTMTQGNGA